MADGLNWYRYANNNPIMYSDPTGMWIDNGDGTHTAEEGDTLHGLYGDNWEEESGWDSSTRPPENLQIGETVGKKRDTSSSDGGSSESSSGTESEGEVIASTPQAVLHSSDFRHNYAPQMAFTRDLHTSQLALDSEASMGAAFINYLSKNKGDALTKNEFQIQKILAALSIVGDGILTVATFIVALILVVESSVAVILGVILLGLWEVANSAYQMTKDAASMSTAIKQLNRKNLSDKIDALIDMVLSIKSKDMKKEIKQLIDRLKDLKNLIGKMGEDDEK